MPEPLYSVENAKKLGKKVRTFVRTIPVPIDGQISSTVTRLTQSFLQEINNSDRNLPEYIKMARKDPTVRACRELKCLRITTSFGKYHHKEPAIKKWVQNNLDNMVGSFFHVIGRLGSACGLGFAVAEIVYSSKTPGYRNQWRLKGVNVLDPTRVTFEGKDGKISYVIYRDGTGRKKRIPYSKCIHIVSGFGGNFYDADFCFGDPEDRTAYQSFKAKQAILAEMMVAAKNNATGIWVGKADSNETVEMVDAMGNPLLGSNGLNKTEPAMTTLMRQMQGIENNSVIVTDIKNEIQPLQVQTSEGFWNLALSILDSAIMRAYGVPELIFKEGSASLGQNTIGKQHKAILDAQIQSIVLQIRDQIIEKVVTPLLMMNFGVVDDFGTFDVDVVADPEAQASRANTLISAISSQIIPSTNLSALNALYDMLGIPSVTEEDWALHLQKQLQKQALESQAFSGQIPFMMPPSPVSGNIEPNADAVAEA